MKPEEGITNGPSPPVAKERDRIKDGLVCIYAQLLPRIREEGERLGYAIAVHGSMRRDLDLLAVPWVEKAAPAEFLVEMIAERVSGFVIGDKMDRGELMQNPTIKPHGRMSWNICWGGHPLIDLSVMPMVTKSCPACGGSKIMDGDKSAPVDSVRRHDVPCPECSE